MQKTKHLLIMCFLNLCSKRLFRTYVPYKLIIGQEHVFVNGKNRTEVLIPDCIL